jgi:hypothetical protein
MKMNDHVHELQPLNHSNGRPQCSVGRLVDKGVAVQPAGQKVRADAADQLIDALRRYCR